MVTKTEEKREFFDSIAAQWDSFGGPPDAPHKMREFVRIASAHRPSRILDVGCGTGILVPHLMEERAGAQIVELDLSPQMLAVNKSKHGAAAVEFFCGDLVSAPLGASSFDAILFFNVLPHFDETGAALGRAFGLLAEGGRIAVGHLMGSAELNAFHATVDGPVRQDRLPASTQLAELLEETGFRVLQVDERSDWYLVLAEKAKR